MMVQPTESRSRMPRFVGAVLGPLLLVLSAGGCASERDPDGVVDVDASSEVAGDTVIDSEAPDTEGTDLNPPVSEEAYCDIIALQDELGAPWPPVEVGPPWPGDACGCSGHLGWRSDSPYLEAEQTLTQPDRACNWYTCDCLGAGSAWYCQWTYLGPQDGPDYIGPDCSPVEDAP